MLKLSAVTVTYFSSALGFQWLPAYGHLGHSHEGGSQSNQGGLTARTTPDVRDLDLHNKTLYKKNKKKQKRRSLSHLSFLFPLPVLPGRILEVRWLYTQWHIANQIPRIHS